jgi:hypothetical protein
MVLKIAIKSSLPTFYSLIHFFNFEGLRPRFSGWFVDEKRNGIPAFSPSFLGTVALLKARPPTFPK